MKIDPGTRHVPMEPGTPVLHRKSGSSFKALFGDGDQTLSGQHAVSFDGAGLLGVGRRGEPDAIPVEAPRRETPSKRPVSMVRNALPEGQTASASATESDPAVAVKDDGKLSNPVPRANAPLDHLHPNMIQYGVAMTATGSGNPMPASRSLAINAPSILGAIVSPQPSIAAPARSGALDPADGVETPDRAQADHQTDEAAPDTQAETASEAVSVIVSDDNDNVQVIAALPDLSDDARRQVREAAEDIARTTGVDIGGFSLNGTPLIHNPGSDRRTSWRSHL